MCLGWRGRLLRGARDVLDTLWTVLYVFGPWAASDALTDVLSVYLDVL